MAFLPPRHPGPSLAGRQHSGVAVAVSRPVSAERRSTGEDALLELAFEQHGVEEGPPGSRPTSRESRRSTEEDALAELAYEHSVGSRPVSRESRRSTEGACDTSKVAINSQTLVVEVCAIRSRRIVLDRSPRVSLPRIHSLNSLNSLTHSLRFLAPALATLNRGCPDGCPSGARL